MELIGLCLTARHDGCRRETKNCERDNNEQERLSISHVIFLPCPSCEGQMPLPYNVPPTRLLSQRPGPITRPASPPPRASVLLSPPFSGCRSALTLRARVPANHAVLGYDHRSFQQGSLYPTASELNESTWTSAAASSFIRLLPYPAE